MGRPRRHSQAPGSRSAEKIASRCLYAADEVFLTSTAGGIMPLVEIDGRPIGDDKPGPVSQRIHGLYWALRESGRDGTPIFPGERRVATRREDDAVSRPTPSAAKGVPVRRAACLPARRER